MTVDELEQFFRLDAKARAVVAGKLGWVVQWGTVQMLETFLADTPLKVPAEVVEFAAEQVEVDPACAPDYLARRKTAYEHSWEIRDLLGLSEFAGREQDVRAFIAARVWASAEGPRALSDRAVAYMLAAGILLPAGITTLTRLVSEVRRAEQSRLYRLPAERTPAETAVALRGLLQVPEDRRVSELEQLRTSPVKASGRVRELDRVAEIGGIGAGRVETEPVPTVKLASPARYPRARLLEGEGWEAARSRVLVALELEEEPAGHLASALEGACARVLDGLGSNTAAQPVGGRLQVESSGRWPSRR
ncbi:DUF4158 domain-containing protein [Nonomuraea sp. NPDC050451]|uniref:DUF4158 domain-containing protein n=1 Tax=Nonomuraea sp. NPDC050451 TaxID=3364364 RepID=UPI00379778CA